MRISDTVSSRLSVCVAICGLESCACFANRSRGVGMFACLHIESSQSVLSVLCSWHNAGFAKAFFDMVVRTTTFLAENISCKSCRSLTAVLSTGLCKKYRVCGISKGMGLPI